jgi:hypothetical protein
MSEATQRAIAAVKRKRKGFDLLGNERMATAILQEFTDY